MNNHRPLSLVAIWILIALIDEPCHLYGLEGRVFGKSLAYVELSKTTIRSSVRVLLRNELIKEAGQAPGAASVHQRKLYGITERGLRALKHERISLMQAVRGIDHGLAQVALNRAIADEGLRPIL